MANQNWSNDMSSPYVMDSSSKILKHDYSLNRLAGDMESMNLASSDFMESEDYDFTLDLHGLENSESEYSSTEDSASDSETTAASTQFKVNIQPSEGNDDRTKDAVTAPLRKDVTTWVPIASDEADIDSDEERDILKGIRTEIQNQVREELAGELDVYKLKSDMLKTQLKDDSPGTNRPPSDLDHLDPKLKEAILKMRKLDRILAKKVKREKEVKRERILLERRLREELANIKPEGRDDIKEVKTNTDKFLALTLPPRHNEGVEVEPSPLPPVFPTELQDLEYRDKSANERQSSSQNDQASADGDASSSRSSAVSGSQRGGKRDKKGSKGKKKDFIKRNIQLASDADNPIPMTDEEKNRVSNLLEDLDNIPEKLPEEDDDESSFQVALHPGEGFHPDSVELKSLSNIDHRLKELMLPEEYEMIASSPAPTQHKLFTRVGLSMNDVEFERYGDKALLDAKDQREMQARLERIEADLKRLSEHADIQIESPHLSEYDLQDLLSQCARSLSRTTIHTDFESEDGSTFRSQESHGSIMEHPPKLPDDVLQRLLADAYISMGSARTNTFRSEDEGQGQPTEDEDGVKYESITAETWKTIMLNSTDRGDSEGLTPVSSHRDAYHMEQNAMNSRNGLMERHERIERFLPEIDHNPNLVSQCLDSNKRLNNEYIENSLTTSRSAQTRQSVVNVRNSFSDERYYSGSSDEDMLIESISTTPTPRPPQSDRRPDTGQSSRTITPSLKMAS